MSETMNMLKSDFQEKLNQMLLGEVMGLKVQLALLRGDSIEETAKITVEFMRAFMELFPAENHAQIHEMMGEALRSSRPQDGDK